mgnify:CR=1 FL=1
MIISKQLVIANRKRSVIVAELREKDFRPFPKTAKAHVAADPDDDGAGDDDAGADSDFDYLLGMALYSLTAEKVSCSLARASSPQLTLELLPGRQTSRRARCEGGGAQHASQALGSGPLGSRSRRLFRSVDRAFFLVFSRRAIADRCAFFKDLLEADITAKNKSLRAAKGNTKGKGKGKKRAGSDDSEDDYDVKVVKKAKPAPKPKAKVPLPSDDDIVPAAPLKAAPVKAAPKPKVPLPASDSSVAEVEMPAKVVAKPVVKAAPKKRASLEAEQDEEEDEEPKPAPKKKVGCGASRL